MSLARGERGRYSDNVSTRYRWGQDTISSPGPEASWLKYEARLNDYIYRFLYLEQKLRGRKLSAAAEYYKEQLQKSGEKLKEVKGEGDHTTSSDEFRTFETHCFEYFASCLDGIQTTKGNVAFRSLRQKIAELNRLNMYLLTVLVDAMQHLPLEEGPFQIPKETEIIDQFGDE